VADVRVSVLRLIDPIGPDLLRLDSWALLNELGGPTLARLPGTDGARPRAIVVLQHGDEHTGLDALLQVLREHRPLPYDLHLLFGNVEAALAPPGFAHRLLKGQPDMNRAWRPDGTVEIGDDPLSVATREAMRLLLALDLAAVVDLHNTTGANPYHALVAAPTPQALELAALFTTLVVVWDQRRFTLIEALHEHCPTVAVECGLAGPASSVAFAVDGLRRFLAAPDPSSPGSVTDVELLSRMRRIEVVPTVRFRFGGSLDDEVDLIVAADTDRRNGIHQEPGWTLGVFRDGAAAPLRAIDVDGRDVTDELLDMRDGTVRVIAAGTPMMMTRTVAAARMDCLTYLLTRIG
jgi:succinylglutamate desuccinylase